VLSVCIMKIMFVSRRNNQARYFRKLRDHLPFTTDVHIIGTPYWRAWCYWRHGLRFNPREVVRTQLRRRAKKYPRLNGVPWLAYAYGALINFKERRRYTKYVALFTDMQPEAVGLWNGKKLPTETIVLAARACGIPVHFFENGLLPGTCTIDARGVNAESSLPRDPAFYLRYAFAKDAGNIQPLMPRPPVKARRGESARALPKKFVFVPFQVPDDTQIVCHSPWIGSMEMLFDTVMQSIDQLVDDDVFVVFKEHPSWPAHFDHLYQRHPRALFANGNPTPELIAESLGLVTVNSTVGLEGIQLQKPVIVLGSACYAIPGLVQRAHDSDELTACLGRMVQDWAPDDTLRRQFLRFLNDVYCIPEKWSQAEKHHFPAAAQRLMGEDEFSRAIG